MTNPVEDRSRDDDDNPNTFDSLDEDMFKKFVRKHKEGAVGGEDEVYSEEDSWVQDRKHEHEEEEDSEERDLPDVTKQMPKKPPSMCTL